MQPQVSEGQPQIAAAVIVRSGRVLLVRRRRPEGTLLWQFPAGAVEPGESSEGAAAREAGEEAGVVVNPIRILGTRVHPATGRNMVYVACECVNGEAHVADIDEIAEVTWSTLGDLERHVPAGVYQPVRDYLDVVLTRTRLD